MSLEETAAATHIRRQYLEALEAESFEQLPSAAYAKPYIRSYASYLDVPEQDVLDMSPQFGPESAAAQRPSLEVRLTPATPQSRVRRIIGVILALAAAGAVLLGVMLYGQLRQLASTSRPGPSEPSAATTPGVPQPRATPGAPPAPAAPPASAPAAPPASAPSAPSTTAPTAPAPAAPPAATPAAPPAASPVAPPAAAPGQPIPVGGPVQVGVEASDRSWVRTVADGVTVFEGFVNAGDRQTWQARRELTIRIGNAGAVVVSVNGRSFGRLGSSGEVVVRTFIAETRPGAAPPSP